MHRAEPHTYRLALFRFAQDALTIFDMAFRAAALIGRCSSGPGRVSTETRPAHGRGGVPPMSQGLAARLPHIPI